MNQTMKRPTELTAGTWVTIRDHHNKRGELCRDPRPFMIYCITEPDKIGRTIMVITPVSKDPKFPGGWNYHPTDEHLEVIECPDEYRGGVAFPFLIWPPEGTHVFDRADFSPLN